MSLPCMIFAAGFGRRMGALTASTPKPLLRLGNQTLLDRAIEIALAAEAGPIVVNTHYLGEQIERHCAAHWPEVRISAETPEILETGGGLRHAMPLLEDAPHVFTLNSDVVWGAANPLAQLARDWQADAMDALLLAGDSERLGRVCADFTMDHAGRLTRTEQARGYTYLGAQIVSTKAVARSGQGAFSLNLAWDQIAANGRLFGSAYDDRWLDLGTAAQFEAAQSQAGRA